MRCIFVTNSSSSTDGRRWWIRDDVDCSFNVFIFYLKHVDLKRSWQYVCATFVWFKCTQLNLLCRWKCALRRFLSGYPPLCRVENHHIGPVDNQWLQRLLFLWLVCGPKTSSLHYYFYYTMKTNIINWTPQNKVKKLNGNKRREKGEI